MIDTSNKNMIIVVDHNVVYTEHTCELCSHHIDLPAHYLWCKQLPLSLYTKWLCCSTNKSKKPLFKNYGFVDMRICHACYRNIGLPACDITSVDNRIKLIENWLKR